MRCTWIPSRCHHTDSPERPNRALLKRLEQASYGTVRVVVYEGGLFAIDQQVCGREARADEVMAIDSFYANRRQANSSRLGQTMAATHDAGG